MRISKTSLWLSVLVACLMLISSSAGLFLKSTYARERKVIHPMTHRTTPTTNELESQAISLKSMTEDIRDLVVQTQVAQSTATSALQETRPPYMQTLANHIKAKQPEQGE